LGCSHRAGQSAVGRAARHWGFAFLLSLQAKAGRQQAFEREKKTTSQSKKKVAHPIQPQTSKFTLAGRKSPKKRVSTKTTPVETPARELVDTSAESLVAWA
jgi:hypothetical protein